MEISELAISDDQKDEILAVSRKSDGSEQINRISALPWGVFSQLQPDVNQAKWLLSDYFTDIGPSPPKRIIEYAVLQAKNPQIKLPMFRLVRTEDFLEERMLEMTQNLLGRPVEVIRFSATTTLADILGEAGRTGSVMAAVMRAKCCNPVIVLRNTEAVTDRKIYKVIRQLCHQGALRSFVDRSIGVPFDLSYVLFVEQFVATKTRQRCRTFALMGMLLLPKILAEHGLLKRKSLFDGTLLRLIANSCIKSNDFGKCERILNSVAAFLREKPKMSLSTALINFVKRQGCKESNYAHADLTPYGEGSDMKLPIGCSTQLGFNTISQKGSISLVQTSFSQSHEHVILNPTKIRKQTVDIAYNYLYSSHISTDSRKSLKVAYAKGDGPSNGCSTFLSFFSLLTNRIVRKDSAVTGTLSLSGRILDIGCVNSKTHAAYMWGIRRMVLPSGNKDHVERTVDERLKKKMQFVYVDTIDELIAAMIEEEEEVDEAALLKETFGTPRLVRR